jgi:hypothetical protein
LASGGEEAALDRVRFTGPDDVVPSVFPATAVASGVVAATTLAAAEPDAEVEVDRTHATVACRSERYLDVERLPRAGDGLLGGDLRAADGWIRIHTLYPHHREAARAVLGGARGDAFVTAVAAWRAEDLQEAVVAAGGAAARMRTAEEWAAHPQGARVRDLPLIDVGKVGDGPPVADGRFRVLDLTRVIAGPTASKILAAHGADVLRIEPPDFPESPVLTVDTGFGKRVATVDLRSADGRAAVEALVRDTDVVVHGFRPGALDGLGLGEQRLAELRPGVVLASLSAWGGVGPWTGRRGFDSLVQMASGIAAAGKDAAGADHPVPLPMQLLDHGTAWLLALGVLQARRRQREGGGTWRVSAALARTGAWLQDLGPGPGLGLADVGGADVERYLDEMPSAWGRLRFVRPPGLIAGRAPSWAKAPEPPGTSPPGWN